MYVCMYVQHTVRPAADVRDERRPVPRPAGGAQVADLEAGGVGLDQQVARLDVPVRDGLLALRAEYLGMKMRKTRCDGNGQPNLKKIKIVK